MPTFMKVPLLILLLPLMALAPLRPRSEPAASSLWQAGGDDTQPLDDEFVEALVIMAVDYDMMAGDGELGNLDHLQHYVGDYYQKRIDSLTAAGGSSQDITWLQNQKSGLQKKIKAKINRGMEPARWLISFLDTLTGTRSDFASSYQDPKIPVTVVSGEPDPPADYFETMNSLIMTDFEAQINLLLDVHTVTVSPQVAPAIADLSLWDASVGLSSSSTAVTDQDDEEEAPADPADDSAITVNETRPVRFGNNGFVTVTVLVESYQPAASYQSSKPSASTVVSPEGNSSSSLELPLGTYTFCYEWQLEGDFDGDDYFDYHHRSTSPVTLNVDSNADPTNAKLVNLNPDSVVSNPNGKCADQGDDDAYQLTPAEAANLGTHSYTCRAANGSIFTDPVSISFSGGGMTWVFEWTHPLEIEYTRLEPDLYQRTEGTTAGPILLSLDGYEFQNPQTGGLTRCQRQ